VIITSTPALIALLGIWWAWNTYLVGILPTTFLSSLGRRSLGKDGSSVEDVIRDNFESFVRDLETKLEKKESESGS
jgi:hypothetical protein